MSSSRASTVDVERFLDTSISESEPDDIQPTEENNDTVSAELDDVEHEDHILPSPRLSSTPNCSSISESVDLNAADTLMASLEKITL